MSRVIALGQPAAGDDGVGPAVLAALREAGAPEGAELLSCPDPSALIELLQAEGPIVIVDAVLGERPGEVLALSAARARRPPSRATASASARPLRSPGSSRPARCPRSSTWSR